MGRIAGPAAEGARPFQAIERVGTLEGWAGVHVRDGARVFWNMEGRPRREPEGSLINEEASHPRPTFFWRGRHAADVWTMVRPDGRGRAPIRGPIGRDLPLAVL